MTEKNIKKLILALKAIAHPLRFKIISGLMLKKECNVKLMSEKLKTTQPTVSQHLTVLKNAGVITGTRRGNQICYSITNPDICKMFESLGLSADLIN